MNIPTLVSVQSSNIAAIGYDGSQEKLFVQFKGKGTIYAYADVPAEVHSELMSADSAGRYYSQNIKSAYLSEKVDVANENP